ncbi:MAG: hypothetical protein ACQESW_11345 [Bacteroidota bacterium]
MILTPKRLLMGLSRYGVRENYLFIGYRQDSSMYNQNFDKIKPALTPIIRFFDEFEDKMIIQSQNKRIKINDMKDLIVNMISFCGWQVIGINILNMNKTNDKDMVSVDIKKLLVSG